jgi:hypothetical protein
LQRFAQLDAQQGSAPSIAPLTVGREDDDEEALDAELRRALEVSQREADALLAIVLQNQMLKKQLQQDRGFTAMLDGDCEREGMGGGGGGGRRDAAPRVPAPAPAASWGEMLGL